MTLTKARWGLLVGVAIVAQVAVAHPKGFHKKVTLTVSATRVSALVVMDVDSGDACLLLRAAQDSNRDGVLTGDEVKSLKERLAKLATGPLKVGVSGAPLGLVVKDTKLSMRNDVRASDGPLSIAVLLELEHEGRLAEGMQIQVTDTAPDTSGIVMQVFQAGSTEAPFEAMVDSGASTSVRVGRLGP